MALEIQEIGIRLQVDDRADRDDEAGSSMSKTNGGDDGSSCCAEVDQEAIVNECVERVLRALDAAAQR